VKLLVATRSKHKMSEIRRILAEIPGLEIVDLDQAGVEYTPQEEELEPFDTFEENAHSKATHFQAVSGLPTVADDSGLEVDALDGGPGVRTKRFAPVEGLDGEELDRANNAHLLALLAGKAPEEREARYVCVAVLVRGWGEAFTFRGEAPGRILDSPRGESGFGYDPIFYDEELGRTFAQISREEKNARSHRGAAFRALAEHLKGGL
jgi:XTP/dITP diphosphohydrolase